MGRRSENPKAVDPNKGTTKKELMLLWDMLWHETDEAHPMSGKAICAWLEANNLPHSMDKMAEDLRALESLKGRPICIAHNGTSEKLYYVGDGLRPFNRSELKLISDALQASGAIPSDLTQDLTDRLLTLASDREAETLRQEMAVFNPRKHSNHFILENIGGLSTARRLGRQATFRYFYLNEKRRPVYQREMRDEPDAAPYTVEPLELVYRDDNYYLIAWDCDRERLSHFRVDRMKNVKCSDVPASAPDSRMEEDLAEYTRQVFSMFGGEKTLITLRLHDLKAIGMIYDQFGEETVIHRKNARLWETTVPVRLSPQLWGWLCGSRGLVSLVGPAEVRDQYHTWLMEALFSEA